MNKHVGEISPGFFSSVGVVDEQFREWAVHAGSAVSYSYVVQEQTYLRANTTFTDIDFVNLVKIN